MNAYDACGQIWLLGFGRSMASSKRAHGRLGLRSAAAIDHQENVEVGCSIYFTYFHFCSNWMEKILNTSTLFAHFYCPGDPYLYCIWSKVQQPWEQKQLTSRGSMEIGRVSWSKRIEDRSPSRPSRPIPSSFIGSGEVAGNYSGHGFCLSDDRQTWPELLNVSNNFHNRICLELYSRLLQKMKEIMFEYVWCWNLKPHILKTMHYQNIWLVHLIWPLTHEPSAMKMGLIAAKIWPEAPMVKVVDQPFRSMGEQGMDQRWPTHLYSSMADMPRVFDKPFFSALDCRRNLHNIGENSGGIRGIQHMRWTRRYV